MHQLNFIPWFAPAPVHMIFRVNQSNTANVYPVFAAYTLHYTSCIGSEYPKYIQFHIFFQILFPTSRANFLLLTGPDLMLPYSNSLISTFLGFGHSSHLCDLIFTICASCSCQPRCIGNSEHDSTVKSKRLFHTCIFKICVFLNKAFHLPSVHNFWDEVIDTPFKMYALVITRPKCMHWW